MKKAIFISGAVFALLVIGLIALVVSAQAEQGNEKDTEDAALESEINEVIDANSASNLSTDVYDYVLNFAKKRGVLPSEISKVKEVDFNALPKEVNIENVGNTNLAIYEVSYTKKGITDNVYVITYSTEKLAAQGDIIVAQDKRQFLNFGYAGTMPGSGFLQTATSVETNLDKGYVMPRDGSITAISTNLEVAGSNSGDIEIIVYVNGEQAGFGNLMSTETIGVKKDYDVQSRGIVNFKAGDVISVYLKSTGDVSWKDVITMVEITTTN